MNLILIGPQGSGKGTQANFLEQTYNLTSVELGAVLRRVAQEQSERGHLVNDLINEKGKLLPDGIVFEIMIEYLQTIDWQNGLIFDGYPRSMVQFQLIEDYLVDRDQFLHVAFYLHIEDELAIDRLANRLTCFKCGRIFNTKFNPPPREHATECGGQLVSRPDDQPDAIRTRLNLFHQVTQPILDVVKEKGILETIDASQTPEKVFQDIQGILKRKGLI